MSEIEKIKKNKRGFLPMNIEYQFIGIDDIGEDRTVCNNCGAAIRYVAELRDSNNKVYYVGTECAKTLSKANISNEYQMLEEFNAMKKVATARNIIQKGIDNDTLTIYPGKDYCALVAKTGKTAKKISLEPIFIWGNEFKPMASIIAECLNKKEFHYKDGDGGYSWCWHYIFENIKRLNEQQ